MYTIERKYLLKLGAAGSPADHVEVPILFDEVAQNLTAWVYGQNKSALGAGSVQILRNGDVVSTVAFANKQVPIPLSLYTVGADFEMEMLHPQTSIVRPTFAVYAPDPTTGALVESKEQAKITPVPNMSLSLLVTNTDATAKDVVLLWNALVWRNA